MNLLHWRGGGWVKTHCRPRSALAQSRLLGGWSVIQEQERPWDASFKTQWPPTWDTFVRSLNHPGLWFLIHRLKNCDLEASGQCCLLASIMFWGTEETQRCRMELGIEALLLCKRLICCYLSEPILLGAIFKSAILTIKQIPTFGGKKQTCMGILYALLKRGSTTLGPWNYEPPNHFSLVTLHSPMGNHSTNLWGLWLQCMLMCVDVLQTEVNLQTLLLNTTGFAE